MKKPNHVATLLSTVAIVSLSSAHAAAQETVDTPETAVEEASVQKTIVVTAQRRESTVQDTPFSIKAVDGEELASRQINDPARLTDLAPGIQLATVGQQLALFARGAGAPVANPRADPAAAYSIDGVAVARPISVNGTYFDLARIEVLKGPQGTFVGRNATVGAVNIISNRPSFEREGKVEVEIGNFDLMRTGGVLNVPLSDTFAVRGAIQTTSRDGYLSNGYSDADSYAGRLRTLWQPSEKTSLMLTANYFRDQGKGVGDVPLRSPTGSLVSEDPFLTSDPWFVQVGPVNFSSQVPGNGNQDLETLILNAEFEVDLGFATLTAIPAYIETSYEALSYAAGFERRIDSGDEQTSLEVRLASPADKRLSWIVGGLYLDNKQDGFEDLRNQPALLQRNQFNSLGLESLAVFGQANFSVTDEFRLTAGLRYTDESKDYDGFILNLDLNQNPLPGAQPLPSFGTQDYDDLSYRIGIEYDIGPDSLLYASVATGYKAGGFNVGGPPNTYKPEDMLAYTIGSKNDFNGGRVRLNIEGWYWDYSDVQQVQFGFVNPAPNFGLVTFNAASQESYGVEVETSLVVGEKGVFSVDFTYTNSTWAEFSLPGFVFGPFNIPPSDLSGDETPYAPEWSANLAYEHVIELPNGGALIPRARTRLRTEQTLNTTGIPGSRVEGTTSSDLSLTYETPGGDLEIQGYVNNIEDEPVFAFAGVTPAGLWGSPGVPRTYGVRLVKRFN